MADRLREYFDGRLHRYLDDIAWWKRTSLEMVRQKCESPIEELMAAALIFMETPIYFDSGVDRHGSDRTLPDFPVQREYDAEVFLERVGPDGEGVLIYPQASVLNYRVDFLIAAKVYEYPDIILLVVECDGHDFHEKTKEQARRDKRRDREMLAAGYRVFRFAGSEIHADPDACVEEIRKYLDGLAHSNTKED